MFVRSMVVARTTFLCYRGRSLAFILGQMNFEMGTPTLDLKGHASAACNVSAIGFGGACQTCHLLQEPTKLGAKT